MSGKFTNLRYDPQAYTEEVLRSTDPLLYRLDANYAINCGKCFSSNGPRNGEDAAVATGNKIDVDSILRGVNRKNGNSNAQQQVQPINYQRHMPPDCPTNLDTEHTRFTHPSYDIRGLANEDLRLGYPLHDPQCQIFENFSVNTRLQAKDNHRTPWQTPLSQDEIMPQERSQRVKNCFVT